MLLDKLFTLYRITGAMGKGLAALTFDKEYQKKRREQLNKKPANLQEGLARSGKGLVMVSCFFFTLFGFTFFQSFFRVYLMVLLVFSQNQ